MQPSTFTSIAPNGASSGSAITSTGAGRNPLQLAQREPQHVALHRRPERSPPASRPGRPDEPRSRAPSSSGSSVSIEDKRDPSRSQVQQEFVQRARTFAASRQCHAAAVPAPAITLRDAPKANAAAIVSIPTCVTSLTARRQRIGRQPITMARQRVDKVGAVLAVVQQHDRIVAAGLAIGRKQRPHLAHQRVGGRHRVTGRAGRAGGSALPAPGTQMRVDAARDRPRARWRLLGRDQDSDGSRRSSSANARRAQP